jgi:hypothetical protein
MLALSILSVPLAGGAAPNIPVIENRIVLFIFFVLGISLILNIASLAFRWGWKAKNYGFSFLSFGCVSYLGLVPCAATVLYSSAPYWVRAVVVIVYGVSNFLWCRKFIVLYEQAFNNENLRSSIYEEDSDVVYYMRRGDEFILRKYFKFSQMPRNRYFLACIAVSLLMVPLMTPLQNFVGMPFVHIFLLIAMLPVSWMSIGFAVRGFLIFYKYPAKIKRTTGKDVYVDLVTKPRCYPVRRH